MKIEPEKASAVKTGEVKADGGRNEKQVGRFVISNNRKEMEPKRKRALLLACVVATALLIVIFFLISPGSPLHIGSTNTQFSIYNGTEVSASMPPSPGYTLVDKDSDEYDILGDFAIVDKDNMIWLEGIIEGEGFFDTFSKQIDDEKQGNLKIIEKEDDFILYEDEAGYRYAVAKAEGIPGDLTISLENCPNEDARSWISKLSFKSDEDDV